MIYRISIINADGEVHYKWVLEENIDTITGTAYYDLEKYGDELPWYVNMSKIIMKNGDVIENIRNIEQVPMIPIEDN